MLFPRRVPPLPPLKLTLLNVKPPVSTVARPLNTTVDRPAPKVNPVVVVIQTPPEAVTVKVLDPRIRVLGAVPVDEKTVVETVWLLVFKVPATKANPPVTVIASCKVQIPAALLNPIPVSVFPFVVMVLADPAIKVGLRLVNVVDPPAGKNTFPAMLKPPLKVRA